MSLKANQAHQLLEPLAGQLNIMLVPDRQTNLRLASILQAAALVEQNECAIFDFNAFYSTNSDSISVASPPGSLDKAKLFLPEVGSNVEDYVVDFFRQGAKVLIIDNLNTLFHLFSSEDSSTAGRKLSFVASTLSFFARTNGTTILVSMYVRERPVYAGRTKLFSSLGDTTIRVRPGPESLTMTCERGTAWESGRFALTTPSC